MKIAISTENGQVSAHFGHCPHFTIFEINNKQLVKKDILDNPEHQPGFLPGFLKNNGVDCIIAGGMGGRAVELFHSLGIETFTGVEGNVDQVINDYLKGILKDQGSVCSHHHDKDNSHHCQGGEK